MKKALFVRTTLLLVILSVFLAEVTQAQDSNKKFFSLRLTAGTRVQLFKNPTTYLNLPEYMRDIPIHPHDEYKVPEWDNAPIENGIVIIPNIFSIPIYTELGPQISFPGIEIRFKAGVRWDLMEPFYSRIMKERDYLLDPGSSERGFGTALTYYRIYTQREKQFPHYYSAEVEIKLKDKARTIFYKDEKKLSLILGWEKKIPYKLILENGWDRWNSLEVRETFFLGKFQSDRVYCGLNWENDEYSGRSVSCKGHFIVGYTFEKQIMAMDGVKHQKIPFFFQFGIDLSIFPFLF